jgi:hypothetical protein
MTRRAQHWAAQREDYLEGVALHLEHVAEAFRAEDEVMVKCILRRFEVVNTPLVQLGYVGRDVSRRFPERATQTALGAAIRVGSKAVVRMLLESEELKVDAERTVCVFFSCRFYCIL